MIVGIGVFPKITPMILVETCWIPKGVIIRLCFIFVLWTMGVLVFSD